MKYTHRTYREWQAPAGSRQAEFRLGESDLRVTCDCELSGEVMEALIEARSGVEAGILSDPSLLTSFDPLESDPFARGAVRRMIECGKAWGVGPMAAVAGAIADEVGSRLAGAGARAVIVENGGDVYARLPGMLRFAVYAGEDTPFGACPVFEADAGGGLGICTSSRSVGPSISLGRADAVTAVAETAAEADAAATAIGNLIGGEGDVERVVESERCNGRLLALYASAGGMAAFWGRIRLVGYMEGGIDR